MRVLQEWKLLPQRLAVHEPTATAVLADLHLGYSRARRRQGDAVPAPTVAEELTGLARACASETIRAVVIAGDLFEAGFDADLYADFLAFLDRLKLEFLGLVPGNHDRRVAGKVERLWPEGYRLGRWNIVHGDGGAEPGSVLGHWHPAVRLDRRKAACFLVGPDQLVLPAYSRDAAGADVHGAERCLGWRRVAIVGSSLRLLPPGTSRRAGRR